MKKSDTDQIRKLREACGAGIMECRQALLDAEGDEKKALEILRKKGAEIAEKKKERELKAGLIECYSHGNGKVAGVVELLSETDFVARSEEFKALAHELAMQVAAMDPKSVDELLKQDYIRNPGQTIEELVNETIGKFRENIQIGRIARFGLGEE